MKRSRSRCELLRVTLATLLRLQDDWKGETSVIASKCQNASRLSSISSFVSSSHSKVGPSSASVPTGSIQEASYSLYQLLRFFCPVQSQPPDFAPPLSTSGLNTSPNVMVDDIVSIKFQVTNTQMYSVGSLIRDGPLHPTLVGQVFTSVQQQQLNSDISI